MLQNVLLSYLQKYDILKLTATVQYPTKSQTKPRSKHPFTQQKHTLHYALLAGNSEKQA